MWVHADGAHEDEPHADEVEQLAQALGQLDLCMVALEVSQRFQPLVVSSLPFGFWRWVFGVVCLAFGFGRWAFGFGLFALVFRAGFWRWVFGRWAFGVGLLALDFSRWHFRVWVFGVGLLTLGCSLWL